MGNQGGAGTGGGAGAGTGGGAGAGTSGGAGAGTSGGAGAGTSGGAAAGAGGGAAAGAGGGAAAGAAQIAIDVEFTLTTDVRQVKFGLTKKVQGADIVWTINFTLFERDDKTKSFPTDPMVSLAVTVDPALNHQAEQASKGLTPAQSAQATGPASDAAKAAKAGKLPQSAAKKAIQKSVQ